MPFGAIATAEDPEVCPQCSGTGWLLSGSGGGAGYASPCSCQISNRTSRLLEDAGIPEGYRHCRLQNFKTSSQQPAEGAKLTYALSAARTYVEDFLDAEFHRFSQTGLLFMGPPGVGKTHLAISVLVELIERYKIRGRFAEFGSLLFQIQSTFDASSEESKREILDPLTEAELLVLDELGAQKSTPWVQDTLYFIINQRYVHRRPTLFTTNYRLSAESSRDDEMTQLSTRISPALLSRLHEMAPSVDLSALSDYRIDFKKFRARVRDKA
jgi:DNA replication protein DnaC